MKIIRSVRGIALMAALALGGCATTNVLRDFSTDGCSLFPDGDADHPQLWSDCCVSHDQAYWRGGSAQERSNADARLGECVLVRTGRKTLAGAMHCGVRLGGSPWMPAWFRWGYGWAYGRGYAPLSVAEQQQADDKLSAYQRNRPAP